MPQFDTHFFSSLIFWEIVSFGILLWVLYKYAFPPILETLETRERRVKESLEQAERHRAEAERIKGDAASEIEHERRKAIQEIRAQTTELALLVAEKVVGRSLNDADHRR